MTAATNPSRRKPGKVGFWIGGLLVVLAIVVGVGGVALGIKHVSDTVDGLQRASVRNGGSLQLEPGTYDVFLEYPGINDSSFPSAYGLGALRITTSEGRPVEITPPTSSLTYEFGDHEGKKVGRLRIEQAGRYVVEANQQSFGSEEVAIGDGDPTDGFAIVGLGILGGLILFVVGVVLLIVSGVRRSRSKRPPTLGYPPAPGGWGAPQGTWGTPAPPAWGAPGAPGAAPGWTPAPAPGSWTPTPQPGAPTAPGGWAPPPTAPPGTAPGWVPPTPPPADPAPPATDGGWPPAPGPTSS
ncbi:hypothetical protein KSP35_06760 [Aquihabitans sp. G128]|uniref:hypothetical protein n=1 Tax=Aquihabitans sp. G128 TaxID=2849779 RepID=UPI001C222D0E|nr:hypothetical protein [Aquihabitans sp. G128]QXC62496.1 hypothetical protein KSP35_06760 [Aquihabitans sp. G128]